MFRRYVNFIVVASTINKIRNGIMGGYSFAMHNLTWGPKGTCNASSIRLSAFDATESPSDSAGGVAAARAKNLRLPKPTKGDEGLINIA